MEEMNLSVTADAFARWPEHGPQAEARSSETGVGRQQLSASVATHLRERIISGRLQPGEFLRIDSIARELDGELLSEPTPPTPRGRAGARGFPPRTARRAPDARPSASA